MDLESLSEQFYQLVAPSLPNEWDVEESLQSLVEVEPDTLTAILHEVPVIWPVSHALCFFYLSNVLEAIPHITTGNLDIWVKELLDQYEKGGLHAVQALMRDVHHFLPRLHGKKGLRLDEVRGRLQPYLNGLAGRELQLVGSAATYTDTESVFVPQELDIIGERDQAFLLYKIIISFQWAALELGTVSPKGYGSKHKKGVRHPLQELILTAKDPLALMQLYHFFEIVRMAAFLERELPGLMRGFWALAPVLASQLPAAQDTDDLIIKLQHLFLAGREVDQDREDEVLSQAVHFMQLCQSEGAQRSMSQQAAITLTELLVDTGDYICDGEPLVIQGELRLVEVMKAHHRQRMERQQRFIETFASYLAERPDYEIQGQQENTDTTSSSAEQDQAAAILQELNNEGDRQQDTPLFIQIDNENIELNQELKDQLKDILDDLGHLPVHYVSSAMGKAGESQGMPNTSGDKATQEAQARYTYDEWDYRRKGFRKNWCVVVEKQIEQVRSTFVNDTLHHYRYQIAMLKKQFEMLQTNQRFMYRQPEGDDIDFDAVVESLADARAGYPPSDRLFINLLRDERDIAVLFLVDMSNSTEGWVGKSIKEALILISEAMEMLDDRYGIYGFSGMRRLRCEIFPIKTLDEQYGDGVRQRIAGIGPKEYTRMAPAIRHMTSLFKLVDAKLRLLVILSDGKPEDYDDYKGDYAIEDTRHALLEARAEGIHPFCITIDKHAQSYMSHMYGPANSIFVDNLKRLPVLMPEIYRTLTT
ncbi:MAG: VWA domain-containing protein [Desulfobulbus propionicus]|nr:MAG: VWA domain-containing protein [Desulfobulbus propionicus]